MALRTTRPSMPRLTAPRYRRWSGHGWAPWMSGRRRPGRRWSTRPPPSRAHKKTATGLVYIPLVEGKGATPDRNDRVSVLYEGKLTDGTVFDSTAKHGGQPVPLKVTGVIPCWTEALQLMKVGGKSRVICPASLAYGDRGAMPTILPGSALEFHIELVDILPKAPPPAAGATPTPPATPATPGATPPAGH